MGAGLPTSISYPKALVIARKEGRLRIIYQGACSLCVEEFSSDVVFEGGSDDGVLLSNLS
jgi:hypothetical protein